VTETQHWAVVARLPNLPLAGAQQSDWPDKAA